jgi:hypothetical protein
VVGSALIEHQHILGPQAKNDGKEKKDLTNVLDLYYPYIYILVLFK